MALQNSVSIRLEQRCKGHCDPYEALYLYATYLPKACYAISRFGTAKAFSIEDIKHPGKE